MSRVRVLARTALLGVVLAVTAVVVPDASVAPTGVSLVRMKHAAGVSVGNDVIWILAVGSDARPGQDMLRARGDALQLVGINTATGAATAIGVPRDSWVAIPGHGREKINSALYFDGPRGMAGAMRNLTGISADYVMVTRFPFFEDMVDDIGGITVTNPRRFADPYLKKEGFRQGRIHLGGYDAMAFSRIRKGLSGGDFDRSANQQRTLRGIHARVRSMARRPGFIERGVMTVLEHMSTNANPAELYEIAQAGAQVEPHKITTCVIRGRVGFVGAASVVFPDVRQARTLGREARDDATLKGCH
ncbi:LytR family transcriptional regulator [Nocardioides seonyuensis]|uniref:LytR family transcriptional regulator n=1 Tax=Nocardioides seonyuensis TaxID=2518371 RepID=A0A4V1BMI5_9ACTN|nr:LCP family protein [Nocardioides seonyuensis]QBX56492.1 LytR family transcriptional regulator [Nocardioides seonyuensis]